MPAIMPLVVMVAILGCGLPPETKESLIAKVRNALEGLNTLSFIVDIREESKNAGGPSGMKPPKRRARVQVAMAKQGRFRVEVTEDDQSVATVLCDGKDVVEWDSKENQWTRYPANQSRSSGAFNALLVIDNAVRRYAESWLDEGCGLGVNVGALVTEPSAKLAERKRVGGRECDVLTVESTVWQGPLCAIVKYELLYDSETHFLVRESSKIDGKLVFVPVAKDYSRKLYRDVRFNPALPADAFAFTPPEGSTFVSPDDPRFVKPNLNGKPAPKFSLPGLDGKERSLAQVKGPKATIVVFWATWCTACKKEIPALVKLHQEFGDKGLAVIGISTDRSLATLQAFVEAQRMPYLILHDPKSQVSQSYLVDGIPHTVLIDKSGVIVKTWIGGGSDELEKEIREEVAKLLVASQTTVPENQAGPGASSLFRPR